MSLARKHFQRVSAAQSADAAGDTIMAGDEHELMAAALWQARQKLKGIQSIERKIAFKREILPEFAAYVDGVLESGKGAQDDVLMTLMLWRLDVGDLAGGLAIAEYALAHDLQAPDRFQRSLPALIAEQTAEEALKLLAQENEDDNGDAQAYDVETLLGQLNTVRDLTAAADMHDQIRAKLYKAIGYAQRQANEPAAALDSLKRAVELHSKVGVKKDIEQLEREVKKQNDGGESTD